MVTSHRVPLMLLLSPTVLTKMDTTNTCLRYLYQKQLGNYSRQEISLFLLSLQSRGTIIFDFPLFEIRSCLKKCIPLEAFNHSYCNSCHILYKSSTTILDIRFLVLSSRFSSLYRTHNS